jgi:uncharacterized protein YecE (DUF72 family)
MAKPKCDIRIGTSGWHYGHWERLYYPEKLPKSKWFEYYARDFDTVEINNTFYQLPKQETFKNWHKQSPANFLYAVKANRFITHIKRLKDAEETLPRFFERAELLKENLGPILYQLPPGFHKDLDRLRDFLQVLPKNRTAVFEFRHESWFSQDTYGLLDEFGVGFCIHDLVGVPTPRVITGKVIYVRFHGTIGRYDGTYSASALKNWAEWMKDNTSQVRGVYAYFNNDSHAYAVSNAKTLKERLCGRDDIGPLR